MSKQPPTTVSVCSPVSTEKKQEPEAFHRSLATFSVWSVWTAAQKRKGWCFTFNSWKSCYVVLSDPRAHWIRASRWIPSSRALIIILETDGMKMVHISRSILLLSWECDIHNVIIFLFSSQKSIKLQKYHLIFWLVVFVLFSILLSTSFSKMTVQLLNGNTRYFTPFCCFSRRCKAAVSWRNKRWSRMACYCLAWNKYL